jgi:hypothetical protein
MRVARRPSWLVLTSALLLPTLAVAQDCYDCILGVFDDPALTSTKGTIVKFEPKDVYIGLKISGDVEDVAGVEFSVTGLQVPVSMCWERIRSDRALSSGVNRSRLLSTRPKRALGTVV